MQLKRGVHADGEALPVLGDQLGVRAQEAPESARMPSKRQLRFYIIIGLTRKCVASFTVKFQQSIRTRIEQQNEANNLEYSKHNSFLHS